MPITDLDEHRVDGASTQLRAYVARPAGSGPWPAVVMIHELFGLDDVMVRQADRMAAAGYLTVAVDLFSDGGARRCLVGTFRAFGRGTGRAFADIESARRWAQRHPESTGKVGVLGFCLGGGFALLTASTGFDVASASYGQLSDELDDVLPGACPIIGSYGGSDPTLRGAAAELGAGLEREGVEHDIKEYPGAGHSFMNDAPNGPRVLRPLLRVLNVGPDPEAAADAWTRIEAFFAQHLR